jgi:hypothetical protein
LDSHNILRKLSTSENSIIEARLDALFWLNTSALAEKTGRDGSVLNLPDQQKQVRKKQVRQKNRAVITPPYSLFCWFWSL